jgi:hypothetical protein
MLYSASLNRSDYAAWQRRSGRVYARIQIGAA